MRTKITSLLNARLLFAAILVLSMSSCGSSKHSQKTTAGINWVITFKPGTTKKEMNKAIDKVEQALNNNTISGFVFNAAINTNNSTGHLTGTCTSGCCICTQGLNTHLPGAASNPDPKFDPKLYISLSSHIISINTTTKKAGEKISG